jgi:2-polyprenyl-3-methyl-5-hydroxy-6-metoxy-1,4-benzoquinol methylase
MYKILVINWSKIVYMLQKLRFNVSYLQKPVWDTGVSPQELLNFIAAHPPGRAMDLGCGTGTNAITLAKSGWKVTGVDFARRAIRIAEKKARQNGVEVDFHLEDVTHLNSVSGTFDLILDMGCFHSLPSRDRPKYIANIDRFLSTKGTYLLYVFFKKRLEDTGPGVTEGDITVLSQTLKIIDRKNGTERGIYTSSWINFQKRG